jgi:hypothetical protein
MYQGTDFCEFVAVQGGGGDGMINIYVLKRPLCVVNKMLCVDGIYIFSKVLFLYAKYTRFYG